METKWPIDFDDGFDTSQRQALWEEQHKSGYSENVWSITEDEEVRGKLIAKIEELHHSSRILVPGCGSEVHLQNDLATRLQGIKQITCTDFESVIAIAKRKTKHPRIAYEARDSKNLGWKNEWDVVVVVNSVLSSSDSENRQILRSCFEVLSPGCALVGYFPTIYAAFEIQTIDVKAITGAIDVRKCLFYEERQGMHQIFYTPLRLRRVLKEAGFRLTHMEIVFIDISKEYYGMEEDSDLAVYELLVVAHKPHAAGAKP